MINCFQVFLSNSTCAPTSRSSRLRFRCTWRSPRRGWRTTTSRQGLTLVPISGQLELFCPPCNPPFNHECVLELLKLSSDVKEFKPLLPGEVGREHRRRGRGQAGHVRRELRVRRARCRWGQVNNARPCHLPHRPISVYRFLRRALTLCPQLCIGVQPGARFPARSADTVSATLYGQFT